MRNYQTHFLNSFIHFSWIVLLFVTVVQCVIWNSWPNLFANITVVISWGLFVFFVLRPEIIKNYSLSFFLILGFVLTQYYFPPLFTLIEGKPLVFNLEVPYKVFLHAIAVLAVILFVYPVYRFCTKKSLLKVRSVFVRTEIFKPPTDMQVWLMGFIGLGAMFYVFFYVPWANVEIEGVIVKLVQGFFPFAYAPFFLPLGRLYGRRTRISRKLIMGLILFFIVLLAISIGRNSRGAFMFGLAAIGFGYSLGLFLGYFSPKIITWKNIFLLGFGVWLVTGPLVDLGTAMVIMRGERDDISRTKLLLETIEVYQDEQTIRQYQELIGGKRSGWDETYLNNIFLARFSNLKFSDSSLELSTKISQHNRSVYDFTIDRFWATFPSPILSYMDIGIDKDRINSMSFGDHLYYQAGGPDAALGGRRSGHFSGTGMAAFGWWYLVIMGVGLIPLFFLLDTLTLIFRPKTSLSSSESKVFISLCGLIPLTSIFMFFPTESIIDIFSFLIRGWVQILILYWLIFQATKFPSRFLATFLKGSKI